MRRNLTPGKVGIDFLDGFIHGAINDALAKDGIDTSGLYQFYAVRVQKRLGGLSEYEEHIARYAIERCAGRRVVEIGTGLGELPIVLALNGMTTAGVEYDGNRQRAAMALHERIASCFPEILERYEFIRGSFPETLSGSAWTGADVTLLFTNVGAGWDADRTGRAIDFFTNVGEIILDLRLFGVVREDAADREELFARIAARARTAELLPDLSPGCYFARFTF